MKPVRIATVLAAALLLSGAGKPALPPMAFDAGKPERVATFTGAMPTGVTASQAGRIFVNFPRWGDPVPMTVAEIVNGEAKPYPPKLAQQAPPEDGAKGLVSVQSVVVDPADRLWILDTGSVKFGPTHAGGPKLVCVDLKTDAVTRTIPVPPDVALRTTYLNDVRFDLKRQRAYITDSSSTGPNGIVVVDLASGKSWRTLNDHPSTKAERGFVPIVEGKALMMREPGKAPKPIGIGADGIAISADGKWLYYCPLASRTLYRVATADLEPGKTPKPETVGAKSASDGMESDAEGRIYVTDYENNAVWRRKPDGKYEAVAHAPKLLWPDTLSLGINGYLYVMANQLHRQASYQNGVDQRKKPYELYRFKVDAKPVLLK